MNFIAALAATNDVERDRLIAAEVATHDWLDLAARSMSHGGWPEKADARVLSVHAQGETIQASIAIDIVELCPQGCNAYPRRFDETTLAEVTIDRHGGNYSIVARDGQPD